MDNRGELCDSVRNFINVTQTTVGALKEMKKSIDLNEIYQKNKY